MIVWHLPTNLNFFHRPKTDLMSLFLSGVSRRVAITLLSLFSPIFIYQIAKVLFVSSAIPIIAVLFYYFLAISAKLLALIFSENLSQKIGFKGTIWLSSVPFIFFIPCLVYASSWPILFLPAAILWGIHSGLFWWGYHGYFIKTADEDHFGQSISEARLLETIAAVLTPFLGAVVINYLGFPAVFILSAVFMIASLVLLGKDHDRRQKRDIKFGEVISLVKSHKSVSLAYIGSSAEAIIYIVVWPVFLFLFFGQVITLGIIISLASLFAAVFALTVGARIDRQGERRIVAMGVPLVFLSWTLRIVKKSLPVFILADSIWSFGQRMVAMPLNALTYRKALEAESAKAILFRETTLMIGALLSLFIMIVWTYLGGGLSGSFMLAAIFSTLPLVAVFKKRIRDTDD
jgi:MFS family permease